MKVVDSHVHLWDRGLNSHSWMDDSALPERLLPTELPSAAPLDRQVVLVEVAADPESAVAEARWFQTQVQTHADLVGFVAQLPFDDRVDQTLAEYQTLPGWKGVRRLFQDDEAVYDDPATDPALHALADTGRPFDLCVRAHELGRATALLTRHPQLTVVLDHCGKPPLGTPELMAAWERDLADVAALPGVHCKLSGLSAEAAGLAESAASGLFRQVIQHCLTVFGPERCLVGSDWPISPLVQGRAAAWFELVADLADPYVAPVLHDNAVRVYSLESA